MAAVAEAPTKKKPVRPARSGRDPNEPMPPGVALTAEQEYNWDLAGYLLLPSEEYGLTPAQLQPSATSLSLEGHDSLVAEGTPLNAILARLCCSADSFHDFGDVGTQLDGPARMCHLPSDEIPAPFEGGTWETGLVNHARSYFNSGGHRFVHGVRVVWCLGGSSGYTVVPGSHKSNAETPEAVRTGDADDALASLGLLQQPPLRPGDVLVVAATALQGLRHPVDLSNGAPARLIIARLQQRCTVLRVPPAPRSRCRPRSCSGSSSGSARTSSTRIGESLLNPSTLMYPQ